MKQLTHGDGLLAKRPTTDDAAASRWQTKYHAMLHAEYQAPMPGNCVICYVFTRLREEKAISDKLRERLRFLARKAEDAIDLGL